MYFKIKNLVLENPKVLVPTTIVHIADIHYSKKTSDKKLCAIAKHIKKVSPDYLCITGDSIDHTKEMYDKDKMESFKKWLSSLATDIQIMISIGNHDFNDRQDLDIQYEFWYSIKNLHKNIHLLHNTLYEDKRITFLGFTQTKKYYKKKQEDKVVMLEQLREYKKLLIPSQQKLAISLIHSPLCLTEDEVSKKLLNFQLILAGHTHNGVVPPIIDEIWKTNTGIIEPNKKLIAKNARGIVSLPTDKDTKSFVNITGGITKISATSNTILQPLNSLFPISVDIIETSLADRPNLYVKKSRYTK